MFTRYGYTTIGIVAIISFLIIVLSFFIQSNTLKIILLLITAIVLLGTLNFFRDPERKTPSKKGIIVSPADGKIILLKNTSNSFVGQNCSLISIFMSPLNVHVNRIPISGKVEYLKYFEGKFTAAFDDKASENNERMETGLVSENGKILFTQVAGFVARRIINELKIGDSVKIAERFGMIKFGSRVDVFAPENWEPVVKMNESVTAGETILFELKEK
jgi:phosphatidylserine decarboxylase